MVVENMRVILKEKIWTSNNSPMDSKELGARLQFVGTPKIGERAKFAYQSNQDRTITTGPILFIRHENNQIKFASEHVLYVFEIEE